MISNEYLAGVADSDGSFSYTKKFSKPRNKYYYIGQFQITWKYSKESKIFFDFLVKKFGGSYFDGMTHTSYGKTRILKYCATGKACNLIGNTLAPYLILKKEQALITAKAASLKSKHWGSNGKPKKVWLEEERLYKRMNKINHKNKKHG